MREKTRVCFSESTSPTPELPPQSWHIYCIVLSKVPKGLPQCGTKASLLPPAIQPLFGSTLMARLLLLLVSPLAEEVPGHSLAMCQVSQPFVQPRHAPAACQLAAIIHGKPYMNTNMVTAYISHKL